MKLVTSSIKFIPSKPVFDSWNFGFFSHASLMDVWSNYQENQVFIDWEAKINIYENQCINEIIINIRNINFQRNIQYNYSKNMAFIDSNKESLYSVIVEVLRRQEIIDDCDADFLNNILYPDHTNRWLTSEGIQGYAKDFFEIASDYVLKNKLIEMIGQSEVSYEWTNTDEPQSKLREVELSFGWGLNTHYVLIFDSQKLRSSLPYFDKILPPAISDWLESGSWELTQKILL